MIIVQKYTIFSQARQTDRALDKQPVRLADELAERLSLVALLLLGSLLLFRTSVMWSSLQRDVTEFKVSLKCP